MRALKIVAAAAAIAWPAPLWGEEGPLGDGSSIPPVLEFDAVYTGEVWHNEGGVADGWRYLDNLDLTLAGDLDRAVGLPNTRAFAYVLYNNGSSLSDLTGDALVVSNIETGVRALRLYEAWIDHGFAPGASVRVGLYDLNSEFDALETSTLFIGSAHGIGADISQSGENGPSIFPVTSLAARLSVQVSEDLTVRGAVLDAVPGNPQRPARTAIRLDEGALMIAEADWRIGETRLLAGAWSYTDPLPRIDGTGPEASRGAYLRGEMCLAATPGCGISGFFRVGVASPATNPFDTFVSAGVVAELSASASFGLAVAHVSGEDRPGRDTALHLTETAYEATLAWQISPRVSVQPNVQYIRNEGGPAWRSATVVGLRVSWDP